MIRARILAGAAVLTAACALPSAANAQIGPCPTLLPPPCIVIDPAKIVQSTAEIANKTKQIAQAVQKAKEMTSIQGVLGKVKAPAMGGYNAMAPIAPIQPQSIAAASSEVYSRMPAPTGSDEQQRKILADNRIYLRGAAADGYAMSQVVKQRLQTMGSDVRQLQAEAVATGADVRTDWQINGRARNLMMRALMNLREVQAARVNLAAMMQLSDAKPVRYPTAFKYAESAAPRPAQSTAWGQQLGRIADLTNKLQSLKTAKQLSGSYKDSIAGFQQTQAEYQMMLGAANQSQARLQSLANTEASRKRVSAATLMNRANQLMSARDQTTWDNQDKAKIAKKAAEYTEDQLDKLVSGDVSNSWSDYLVNRAEAYKQEAFFRPINEDAKAMEADTRRYMQDFEQSVGFPIGDVGSIDRQIAQVNAELAALGKSLDAAPDAVRGQRDAIFKSTMAGSDYTGGNPNMEVVNLGNGDIDPSRYGYDRF